MTPGDEGNEGDLPSDSPTAKSSGERDLAKRRTYIATRLSEIQNDIRILASEREELTATLKARAGEMSAEVKNLRDRRVYVATRLEVLRSEQKTLSSEKQGNPNFMPVTIN